MTIEWSDDPGMPGVQAPLTYGGDYVISHHGIRHAIPAEHRAAFAHAVEEHGRFRALEMTPTVVVCSADDFVLSYRPPGEHHGLGHYRSLAAAQTAAERHAAGTRCSCESMWSAGKGHEPACGLHVIDDHGE